MTTHSFNVAVARDLGVEKAILLHNIAFWLDKNLANDKHFYDGRVWTYNSREAFSKLFPYWSAQKIGRLLRELEEQGVIRSANYNQSAYDRTKWYTIDSERYVVQDSPIDCSEMNASLFKNEQPIPDINTDNKTDDIEDVIRFESIRDVFNKILGDKLGKIRSMTSQRKKHIRARIKEDAKRHSVDWWEHYFRAVELMGFLMGEGPVRENGTPWKADIDWLINETNMVKVLEGKYAANK